MSNIGDNIRRAREKAGLTQDELAQKLGYKTRSSIAKIENGTNDIPQSKIVSIANALDTTPAVLMGWDDFNGERIPEYRATSVQEDEQIDNVYFSLAREAQDDGIDPQDIRDAIELIRKLKKKDRSE